MITMTNEEKKVKSFDRFSLDSVFIHLLGRLADRSDNRVSSCSWRHLGSAGTLGGSCDICNEGTVGLDRAEGGQCGFLRTEHAWGCSGLDGLFVWAKASKSSTSKMCKITCWPKLPIFPRRPPSSHQVLERPSSWLSWKRHQSRQFFQQPLTLKSDLNLSQRATS